MWYATILGKVGFSYVNISMVSPVMQDYGSGLTVWSHLYYELLRNKLSN